MPNQVGLKILSVMMKIIMKLVNMMAVTVHLQDVPLQIGLKILSAMMKTTMKPVHMMVGTAVVLMSILKSANFVYATEEV